MFFAILTLITSLIIAGVAAWYSITGLAAIFAAAAIPIMIMGGVLEVGKLVTASWLYRNWGKTKFLLKTYLTTAVVVLMFITSMGIFGFLSKAHLDQTIQAGGNNQLQIEILERQIAVEQRSITDAENVIIQLDGAVATLIEYDRIRGPEGALATRKNQAEEREQLNETISAASKRIGELQAKLLPIKKEKIALEAEVGPLKYIAELIYGDEAKDHFDEAVRWIIILIIFVFDPLAVLLLIAANQSFSQLREDKEFNILEVSDDGVRVVDEADIYEPERELEPVYDFEIEDEEEQVYEMNDLDDDPEEPYEIVTDEDDEVVARVPYNIELGKIT